MSGDRAFSSVAVIGQGYVGLPLALRAARKGFETVGVDIDTGRIDALNAGRTVITDISDDDIAAGLKGGKLSFTADVSAIASVDCIMICVPTPLTKTKDPDLTYIVSAAEEIAVHLRSGQLVVLESTTFPGTTEEVLQPILETSGLECGKDFYLAYSPERIDPGNSEYKLENTPKVVGGVGEEATELAAEFYRQLAGSVHVVSCTKSAEMTKLLENIFRSVNIALVNELLLLSDRMDINIWEVIEAASTKPFGYMPFKPGPGLGGHCIPIDPFYLSWKAREYDFHTEFIELSGKINSDMPRYVATRVVEALNREEKSINGASVLLVGVAYKKDVNDVRESPGLHIIESLAEKGAYLSYHDPFIPSVRIDGIELDSTPLTEAVVKAADCVIIVADHTDIDYQMLADEAQLIFDTRDKMKDIPSSNVERL